MKMQAAIFLQLALLPIILGNRMHPHLNHKIQKRSSKIKYEKENQAEFWKQQAQETLKEKLEKTINTNVAKNVILFLGDGMSIPTLGATRVYMGGEEKQLAFEKFPYTGLSKTYCVDSQVADSACSATAYLCGIKGNYGTIGVTGHVKRGDCPAMTNTTNQILSIAHSFQSKQKATGLVTTARVTHASPAGVYAHTAERDWESDDKVISSNYDPVTCRDNAWQLVYGETGRSLNVILGGGRANFLPQTETDQDGNKGRRLDNTNLIKKWLENKEAEGVTASYVSNRQQLLNLDYNETDYLLGLFNSNHISYNLQRDQAKEPSLQEMTEAAIKILSRSSEGYFLFVEGARIDMGHHAAQAKLALDETLEFSKAVEAAVELTSESNTLIIVTADHAHTLSYSGYAERGNDIFGLAGMADDSIPYATLNYANGPGYKKFEGQRYDVSKDDMNSVDFTFPAISPLHMETHGGDDVAVFAKGPWSHLFTGMIEENVIPHLMAYASCVAEESACDRQKEWSSNIMSLLRKSSKLL